MQTSISEEILQLMENVPQQKASWSHLQEAREHHHMYQPMQEVPRVNAYSRRQASLNTPDTMEIPFTVGLQKGQNSCKMLLDVSVNVRGM